MASYTKALTATFATAGWALGGMAGGSIGGMAANFMTNKLTEDLFGTQYTVNNPNWVRSGFLKFFKWLNPFA